ncbi:MAG: hypothetical protein LBE84_00680 [Planctomycetota bacterium]|nr:hypothetical protein [Planctomycetota bacterium]
MDIVVVDQLFISKPTSPSTGSVFSDHQAHIDGIGVKRSFPGHFSDTGLRKCYRGIARFHESPFYAFFDLEL